VESKLFSHRLLHVCIALLLAVIDYRHASAGDWPQIHGPQRNAKAEQETLAATWPAAGPKVIWRRDVGSGFAGAAVVGDAFILFHRVGDEAIAERMNASSGKPVWMKKFPTHYVSSIAADNGPRCTPLVFQNCVYLFGADGDMHALALADGQELWSRQLYQECQAPSGYFGAGSSPIVEGGLLLVNVGGKQGYGLVALDPNTGQNIWHGTDEQASYSSPVAATLNGQRDVVFVTRLNVVGVDPKTGAERFRFPFGARGPTVNAANPLVFGNRIFVTSNYGVGARLGEIGPSGVKTVWENDESFSSQYTTPVEHNGFLYGIHGRQDLGVAELRCIELATGKVKWAEEGFGTANLIGVGDKLLIQKTGGELVMADARPDRFAPLATARIFPDGSIVQALPALAAGKLFVRDEKTLIVLQLSVQ
jgi:outer membrane protein assembly factor BamB